jgi:hypothetical protein
MGCRFVVIVPLKLPVQSPIVVLSYQERSLNQGLDIALYNMSFVSTQCL